MDYRGWYERVYPELTRAGLWLRGGELNSLARAEYDRRQFRALFVRLSTYFDTGYSFTHQILYQMAANTPGVFPDVAYLPPRADLGVFARDKVPWLLGTQTKLGPEAFDLIGFSNSIAQELLNLPAFLEKSGIPLAKSERMSRSEIPLLILGGANALYSTAAWFSGAKGSAASLIDGVFVGESDKDFRRILEICRDGKKSKASKQEILRKLVAGVPGFLEPEMPVATSKSFIPNLNQSEALESGLVSYVEEQLGSCHLQISEGCPAFCSFCAESWDRKPYRERSAAQLRETALRAKAAMGLDSIDLYSFNFNMHSGFYQLLWDLIEPFRGVGLKSQRFDLLAHDPLMVEFQHAIEKASLTCGLEGISPRLRAYLRKNLEDAELHRTIAAIFKSKARELKVFLIATGLEEEQDFAALGELLDRIRAARQSMGAGTRLIFSMTPLVRFPWTPLEFEDAFPMSRYEQIIARAAGRVRGAGFEFRESADLPEYWVSQILVRAADPAISEALLSALRVTGFIYYREIPEGFRGVFERELKGRGLDPELLLKGSSPGESATKPWTAVDTGVRREFLWEELQRARQFAENDYCLGRSWTKARCFHCGGCPTRYHVRDIVMATQKRGYNLEQFKDKLARVRKSEQPARLLVDAGESARGVPRKLLAVAVARALMLTEPRLTPFYRGFTGSVFSDGERDVWVIGEDALTMVFRDEGLELLGASLGDSAVLGAVNAELGSWGRLLGFAPEGWQPERIEFEAPFELKADSYLKARGLKHTLRKKADGGHCYELIPQSAKKGFVTEIVARRGPDGLTSGLVAIGPKFNAREFATETFAPAKAFEWIRARLVARGPSR